ncbi:hypothetical protein HDU99_010447, partial [Rhizoclosmatium hyalinum]
MQRCGDDTGDGTHLACQLTHHQEILQSEYSRVFEAVTAKKARQKADRKNKQVSSSHLAKEDKQVSHVLKFSHSRR